MAARSGCVRSGEAWRNVLGGFSRDGWRRQDIAERASWALNEWEKGIEIYLARNLCGEAEGKALHTLPLLVLIFKTQESTYLSRTRKKWLIRLK